MPIGVIRAFAHLKKSAAIASQRYGNLSEAKKRQSQQQRMKYLLGNWMIIFHLLFGKQVAVRNQT